MRINTEKKNTEAMKITKVPRPPDVYFGNYIIKQTRELKYLGSVLRRMEINDREIGTRI